MKPGHLMKGFVNQSLIDAMLSDVVKSNILLREPQIFAQFFERVRFAFTIVGEIKDRDVIDVLPAPSLLLLDRTTVVSCKSVPVSVDLVGRRIFKQQQSTAT